MRRLLLWKSERLMEAMGKVDFKKPKKLSNAGQLFLYLPSTHCYQPFLATPALMAAMAFSSLHNVVSLFPLPSWPCTM